MNELESLFNKFSVPKDISYLAKVQTLISIHNVPYDYVMKYYVKPNSHTTR